MPISVDIIILICLVAAAVWAVLTRSLLRAAIALALTSAILSVLMFRLGSGLAAVFELSVCSGLISVLFISTLSLTATQTSEERITHMRERLKRFKYLIPLLAALGIGLGLLSVKLWLPLPGTELESDARRVLWHQRQPDLVAQVAALLAGAFGIVILFKERDQQ